MQMIANPFSDRAGNCRGGASATLGRLALIAMAWGAAVTAAAQPAVPVAAASAAMPAGVLGELRGGGFVIYIRHASTVHAAGDEQNEALGRCESQRNLSDKGRGEALLIGRAFRTLGIPIGAVVASPYCRAKETAALAFGNFSEDPDLGFVMGTNADETRRRAESLRQMLGSLPAKGVNNAIVSHSANLYEAAGIFAKPEGAIYIFKPLGGGRFEMLARILPEELSESEKKTAQSQPRANGASMK